MSLGAVLSRLDSIQSSIDGLDDGTGQPELLDSTAAAATGSAGGTSDSAAAFAGVFGGGGVLGTVGASAAGVGAAGMDAVDTGGFGTAFATMNASAGSGASVTGAEIVGEAEKYLGVPYKLGGESTSGIDCSGLVQLTLKNLGISVPRGVIGQASVGTPVSSLAQAQPGDLVVLKGDSHVMVYAGDGMVVHAPYPGRTVSLQKIWFSDADVATIRRVTTAGAGS